MRGHERCRSFLRLRDHRWRKRTTIDRKLRPFAGRWCDRKRHTLEPLDRIEPVPARRVVDTFSPRPSQRRSSAAPKKYIYFPEPAEAAPGDFETVVISYNRPAVIQASYDPAPVISDCEKPVAPRTKKRSYFAKAAPVVKKPWEVMKSIASKLYWRPEK